MVQELAQDVLSLLWPPLLLSPLFSRILFVIAPYDAINIRPEA
jgi:hypothetical protein